MKLKDRAWHSIKRVIDEKVVTSTLDEMIRAWLAGWASGCEEAEVKCCESPDVTELGYWRWYYVGGELRGAFAYCKNCSAEWKLAPGRTELVRK